MTQQLIALVACLIIIGITEPAINRMSRCTPLLLRLAFWLLCVSAAAAVLFILLGEVPPWSASIGSLGIAIYLLSCRRERQYQRRKVWHG